MSQFITRPMNSHLLSNKEPISPMRITELKQEEQELNSAICDPFPNENNITGDITKNDGNDEKDRVIPNEEADCSCIPNWLETMSKKYLCVSLVSIENTTNKVYNTVINHRVCINIKDGCDIISEISEEVVELRL